MFHVIRARPEGVQDLPPGAFSCLTVALVTDTSLIIWDRPGVSLLGRQLSIRVCTACVAYSPCFPLPFPFSLVAGWSRATSSSRREAGQDRARFRRFTTRSSW